jgi:3-hydroxy-9,10-secoandrosta-1,3,5(10)-triene-9,17-dione monooxygenase reductase component
MKLDVIDAQLFRRTLGHYASGITIVGGMVNALPVGFPCQSFHSVSITPPLVSLSVMQSSSRWPKIRATGQFSVSVLSDRQRHISDNLARPAADTWAAIDWNITRDGNPIIASALIWLDCKLYAEHDAGDHVIVIGQVHDMSSIDSTDAKTPLLYFKGKYHQLAT